MKRLHIRNSLNENITHEQITLKEELKLKDCTHIRVKTRRLHLWKVLKERLQTGKSLNEKITNRGGFK